MPLKKPLFAFLFILLILGYPAGAGANPNQANQANVKEIKDYNPDVSFHSQGHIQRWNNSPLREQNPHLWTAMLVSVIASGGVFTAMLIRKKRREAKESPAAKLDQYLSELKTREERLTKKFKEADRRYRSGEITEADYKRILKSYEENLAKTQEKIKRN